MNSIRRSGHYWLCSVIAGVSLAGNVAAQSDLALEEIIVTAQKRAENLQDIAVSVTALNAATIERLGIQTSNDITRIAPTLTLQVSNNKTNSAFSIRGIGTNVFGIGVEQAVSMIVDDVAFIQQGQSITNLADIERIEVLRGPQSTLFGKAASAGVINVTTKAPSDELEGSVELSVTDESEQRVLASMSGPIGDSLGYRISGYWYDHDGWGQNLSEGQNDKHSFEEGYGFRGKLQWDISDRVSATLTGYMSDEDADCCARIFRDFDGLLIGAFDITEGITPSEENLTIRRDAPSNANTETEGFNLRVSADFGDYTFMSISAYDNWSLTGSEDVDFGDLDVLSFLTGGAQMGGWFSDSWREQDFYSQEFRLISPSYDAYDYVVGLYYSDATTDRTFFRNLPIAPADWGGSSGTEQLAVFGQINWNLSDKTRLSTGLRWFDEEISGEFTNALTTDGLIGGTASDDDIVGKIAIQQFLADDVMLFASYTRGYKGQAYDITTGFTQAKVDNPVKPETADAFEIGIKSTFWDDRAQLNITAFTTKYDNFQVQASRINSEGLIEFDVRNAGELLTTGLEIESVTRLSEAFTLTFNAAFVDGEVNDLEGAGCYPAQTAEQGCDPATNSQFVDGGALPNTPDTKFTVILDYDQTLNGMPFDVFGSFLYAWQDEVQFGVTQNPLTIHDSYGIANLRVGIRDKSERYEITAFVNNLFDENYVGSILDAGGVLWGGTAPNALLHNVPRASQQYAGIKAKLSF